MENLKNTTFQIIFHLLKNNPELLELIKSQSFEVNDIYRKLDDVILEVVNHLLTQQPEFVSKIDNLIQVKKGYHPNDFQFIRTMPSHLAPYILELLPKYKAQFKQDLFVLSELNFIREGFFVEFGASAGILGSNSYLLEKEFNWSGILAEPSKRFHAELFANRSAKICIDCVYKESGESVIFNEVTDEYWGGLSTIDDFSNHDHLSHLRRDGLRYEVKTISLNDLLSQYNAPKNIDYLSIDTEGSEFEILSNFDFSKHHIKLITVEHNFTSNREKLYELLTSKGYVRKYEELSDVDDWYVFSPTI